MRIDSDQIKEGPPWQPQVWSDGPTALVAQARADLFNVQQTLDTTLDTARGAKSMSGAVTQPQNDSDVMVAADPSRGSPKQEWDQSVSDMLTQHEDFATPEVNPAP